MRKKVAIPFYLEQNLCKLKFSYFSMRVSSLSKGGREPEFQYNLLALLSCVCSLTSQNLRFKVRLKMRW